MKFEVVENNAESDVFEFRRHLFIAAMFSKDQLVRRHIGDLLSIIDSNFMIIFELLTH